MQVFTNIKSKAAKIYISIFSAIALVICSSGMVTAQTVQIALQASTNVSSINTGNRKPPIYTVPDAIK